MLRCARRGLLKSLDEACLQNTKIGGNNYRIMAQLRGKGHTNQTNDRTIHRVADCRLVSSITTLILPAADNMKLSFVVGYRACVV